MDRITSLRVPSAGPEQQRGTLFAILALIGFTAIVAQVVLMRELMVAFHGNEMSLGWMLASWLTWTAIGSGVLGRVAALERNPERAVASLELLAAFTLPLSLFLVRMSKTVFQSVPGEVLGPGPMVLTSLIVLAAFCLVSGGLFAAGSRLYARWFETSTPRGTSEVYLLEAVGSAFGGLLASLALIRSLAPFEIALLLSLLNLLGAAYLLLRPKTLRWGALVALVLLFVFYGIPAGGGWLERESLGRLWRGYDLLATRNSIYGNLAVVRTGRMHSLFENGLVTFNVPDPLAAEEAVHFALLEHPAPESLLLVGGGANGSLREALRYATLKRVDYVELDPTVLGMAQEFFPSEWEPVRSDPRVHIHNTDGRLFLKTTKLQFDVVILNLPDPQTAQFNRFYTVEFFREVARRLTPTGVFSFELKGAEDYIGPELADFLRCIERTLREVFPEVLALPGDTVHFFSSPQPGSLTADPGELVRRLRERSIRTSYVREYYLPYRMMPDRMLDLASVLRVQPETRVNQDFAPVAYYYDVALWSTRFSRVYRSVFERLGRVRFGPLATIVSLVLVALAAGLRWAPIQRNRFRASAGFSVATMGFTLIGLEMLLLLAFQALYGYVYQQLAILIASFMVGMAVGSWWGLRQVRDFEPAAVRSRDFLRLAGVQLLAAVAPLLLYALMGVLATSARPAPVFLASQVFFPLLAVLCGSIGGYQFPLASRIFFARQTSNQESPGTLYALDLLGACLGALVLSSYLVPVFGFERTAWLMAVANLAPTTLLASQSRLVHG